MSNKTSEENNSVMPATTGPPVGNDSEENFTIKIDGRYITVSPGTTILNAARGLGIDIPTMCQNDEVEHFNSCMICLVKNVQNGRLYPSCSMMAQEGMEIVTSDNEIHEARQTCLELLLSDHVGDCEAPCTVSCPAHMDIPSMNRLLAAGMFDQALKVVRQTIALPSVLGYICPAPCEGACRRKSIDGAVSICLLKRFSGIEGRYDENPLPLTGQKVAIIGSGPAGLSAAYYLQLKGVQTTIYDKALFPGGMLRTSIDKNKLPQEILDHEIQTIKNLGVHFCQNDEINKKRFEQLQLENDAILIASGLISEEQKTWGIIFSSKGFEVNEHTFQTNLTRVFVAGNAIHSSKLAIRSLAQGKEAATSIWQLLNGKPVVGLPITFNSKFGKLVIPEYAQYLKESIGNARIEPSKGHLYGLSTEEVKTEASRCLHCDCRKIESCKLREYSNQYKAVQKRFSYDERKTVRKQFHKTIVYEPEKCIKCGICVRLTAKYQEKYGFTYIGRGFDVEIGIPFNENINKGLKLIAEKVADECPTGALGKR